MANLNQIEHDLSDPDRATRYRAIYSAAQVDDPRAGQLLVERLNTDSDREIRALAAKLLLSITQFDPLPALLEALKHDRHATVRRAIVETLGHRQRTEAAVTQALTTALYDKSKMVRQAAIQSLQMLDVVEALPELIGVLLGDKNSQVRCDAAHTLELIGDVEAIPALGEALEADSSRQVRWAAATALGVIGDEQAINPLKKAMLHDSESTVRYAAAQALGSLFEVEPSAALVRSFIRVLDDDDTKVWHIAAENLWSKGELAFPIVVEALLDEDKMMQRLALKAVLWLTAEFDDDTLLVDTMHEEWIANWGWWN